MSGMQGPPTGAPLVAAEDPFSRGAVLLLVMLGAALFVALLYMIGSGSGMGSANDGEAHAGSRGLTGYAALADYWEARGHPVRRVRNEGALKQPGLVVLTPPAYVDAKKLAGIVESRRYVGPTLVVTPKWLAAPAREEEGGDPQPGWVRIAGTNPPEWKGFLDDVGVALGKAPGAGGRKGAWCGQGVCGHVPDPRALLSGSGERLEPLVMAADGRILAARYIVADDTAPVSVELPGAEAVAPPASTPIRPLVLVFEPDLLDNWGMASPQNAALADALLAAMAVKPADPVLFDLTLNGMGQSDNLLTLAFRPPFLAATLCLMLAALVLGWRAFLRFGPPLRQGRAIAFGKRALIANAAGLVRRSKRLHLIAGPYADASRERLVRALALPRHLPPEAAEAAIDSALHARDRAAEPFSAVAARLRASRKTPELVQAARDLAALERKLTR